MKVVDITTFSGVFITLKDDNKREYTYARTGPNEWLWVEGGLFDPGFDPELLEQLYRDSIK